MAWLDGELPEEEAAAVARHVAGCRECRDRADAFERASDRFAAYCDAMAKRRAGKWELWPQAPWLRQSCWPS
jgi:anti-sigma factor RsiW